MYKVQTYEEILGSLQNSAKEQFGDEFNVSSTSNWHRILGLPLSLLLTEKSQNIKDLEDRMSIYKASGQDLDDLSIESNHLKQQELGQLQTVHQIQLCLLVH